jgi:hypothetical protein
MADRFHLTLTTAGHPVAHGWWADRTVADGKFASWIGSYSGLPDARVTLVDEETGSVLATWPDEA